MPEEYLGGDKLKLGGRFIGIENKDIPILEGGFKHGDHALQRGGGIHEPVGLVHVGTDTECRQTIFVVCIIIPNHLILPSETALVT